MSLHLIKLCVGVSEVGELSEWIRSHRPIVHTRMTPKRVEELLDGGSLFWVIKGQVLVRQAIIGIETIVEQNRSRCEIELSKDAVLTLPQPRRAFQGWRYLSAADVPADLESGSEAAAPGDLAAQLRSLGAW